MLSSVLKHGGWLVINHAVPQSVRAFPILYQGMPYSKLRRPTCCKARCFTFWGIPPGPLLSLVSSISRPDVQQVLKHTVPFSTTWCPEYRLFSVLPSKSLCSVDFPIGQQACCFQFQTVKSLFLRRSVPLPLCYVRVYLSASNPIYQSEKELT